MVYTQRAPRRQQSHVAPARHVTNCDKQRRCKYTTSVDIQKCALKGIQSIRQFRITWDKSAVRMLENREKSYI